MAKTHQRNVSHISLASTASGGGPPARSWADRSSSCDEEDTPLPSPRQPDTVALVGKHASRVELVTSCTLKRFKTATACTTWLSKRLRRAPRSRIAVVMHEAEDALLGFLRGAVTCTALVAGVVVVGEAAADAGVLPVRQVARFEDAAEVVALLLADAPRGAATESVGERVANLPDRPVWVDPRAEGDGFACAAAVVRWIDRQLKLWHQTCAHCTLSRRCERCCKEYRQKRRPAWPWLGDARRALVAAHFAPVLAEYLARFQGLPGPFSEVAVYGAPPRAADLAGLAAGGAEVCVFASLEEAAAHFEAGNDGASDHSHTSKGKCSSTTQEPSSRSASPEDSSLSDDCFSDVDVWDEKGASTPTPLDYDHPWLLDTDAHGRPLDAPAAVPAVFSKPFPAPATQRGPYPMPVVFVQGVPCVPCTLRGETLTPCTWGMPPRVA